GGRGRVAPDLLGEPEVEDLETPVLRDEHVLGLQIAVDDSFVVGGREAARELEGEVEREAKGERGLEEPAPEGLTLKELGDEERATAFRADVEDGDDVGMVEGRDGPRLQLEAPQAVWIGREAGRKHLDRDVASQARVPRPVHLAHRSGAERGQDLIRAETSAGGKQHGRDYSPP